MRWLASDVPELHRAMLNLITKYPIKDSRALLEAIGKEDSPYYGFLVSELRFGGWFSLLKADLVDEARKHIDNANSLIKSKKLPGESRPREVGKEEISVELARALLLLKQQVDYSFSHQEGNIEWARAPDNPNKLKEIEILQLIEVYDNYRAEISNVTTKLEFILSYSGQEQKQTGL